MTMEAIESARIDYAGMDETMDKVIDLITENRNRPVRVGGIPDQLALMTLSHRVHSHLNMGIIESGEDGVKKFAVVQWRIGARHRP